MNRDAMAAAVEEILGGVVTGREFVEKSLGPDGSDLHVNRTEARRNKRQAQVGLASNVLGLTAGVAAVGSAARDPRLRADGAPRSLRRLAAAADKVPQPISRLSGKGPKAAAGLAAGALGLQVANTGGDVITNAVLRREANKKLRGEKGAVRKDAKKQLAFGWLSQVERDGKPVLDIQKDVIALEELEDAAYRYVKESRVGGLQHQRDTSFGGDAPLHAADMVESFVVTPEKLEAMGVPAEVAGTIPVGWWGGYHIPDQDTFAKVESRELPGFSVHGSGVRQQRPLESLGAVAKAASAADSRKLQRMKRVQADLSVGAGLLGLSALGTKGASVAAARAARAAREAGHTEHALDRVRRARKLNQVSIGLTTTGAGVGGASSLNFARKERKEADVMAKSDKRMSATDRVAMAADRVGTAAVTVRRVAGQVSRGTRKERVSVDPEQSRHLLGGAMTGGLAATGGAFGVRALQQGAAANREAASAAAKAAQQGKRSAAARAKAAADARNVSSGQKILRAVKTPTGRGAVGAATVAAGLGGAAALTGRNASRSKSYNGGWYGRG